MTNPVATLRRWTVLGRWSAPISFHRPSPPPPPPPPSPPTPVFGIYDTELEYGGTRHAENHQLWVFARGCRVLGVPVEAPDLNERILSFTNQPDATRAGKPWAASVTFGEDGFSGWCQFPGEGQIGWYGRRILAEPPAGEWDTDLFYGGGWQPEDHRLRIASGLVEVAGVPIAAPIFTADGLSFDAQPGASRGGAPVSGSIRFVEGGFDGSCQFPGEGAIPWRSRPLPHPPYGTYRTELGIAGRWYDEGHVVEMSPAGVRIAGVTVVGARLTAATLDFTDQPDAARATKPWAGHLVFDDDRCSGWCQFPGEGPVDWRGVRI